MLKVYHSLARSLLPASCLVAPQGSTSHYSESFVGVGTTALRRSASMCQSLSYRIPRLIVAKFVTLCRTGLLASACMVSWGTSSPDSEICVGVVTSGDVSDFWSPFFCHNTHATYLSVAIGVGNAATNAMIVQRQGRAVSTAAKYRHYSFGSQLVWRSPRGTLTCLRNPPFTSGLKSLSFLLYLHFIFIALGSAFSYFFTQQEFVAATVRTWLASDLRRKDIHQEWIMSLSQIRVTQDSGSQRDACQCAKNHAAALTRSLLFLPFATLSFWRKHFTTVRTRSFERLVAYIHALILIVTAMYILYTFHKCCVFRQLMHNTPHKLLLYQQATLLQGHIHVN